METKRNNNEKIYNHGNKKRGLQVIKGAFVIKVGQL